MQFMYRLLNTIAEMRRRKGLLYSLLHLGLGQYVEIFPDCQLSQSPQVNTNIQEHSTDCVDCPQVTRSMWFLID